MGTLDSRANKPKKQSSPKQVTERLFNSRAEVQQRIDERRIENLQQLQAQLKAQPDILPLSKQLASRVLPIYSEGRIKKIRADKKANLARIKKEIESHKRVKETQDAHKGIPSGQMEPCTGQNRTRNSSDLSRSFNGNSMGRRNVIRVMEQYTYTPHINRHPLNQVVDISID